MRMMRIWPAIFTAIMSLGMLSGCGFFSGDHEEQLAADESVYETGKGVPAVPYGEAQTITLYLGHAVNGKTVFSKVTDGDFLQLDQDENGNDILTVKALGVKVTPRKANGVALDQRVFLSNGGWDYQVEATFDEDRQMYLADFKFMPADIFLTHPVLVQVIYPDGKASKEKFIFHTRNDAAQPGMLVDRGLALTLSESLLHQLAPALKPLLEQQGVNLDIQDLAPADNTSGGKRGVIRANLGFASADIILEDTYTPLFGSKTRALALGVEDLGGGGTEGSVGKAIGDAFFGLLFKNVALDFPVMAVGLNLGDLLSGLGGDSSGNALLGMLSGLKLDATLFLNLFGLPEPTKMTHAVIAGALYAIPTADVQKDADGNPLWPSVTIDPHDTGMDLSLIKNDQTDIGMALSQYNLNQTLSQVAKQLSLTIPAIQKLVPMFTPANPGDDLDLTLTLNPAGMAIDVTTRRLVINDIHLLFVEKGIPQSELSLDLTMLFGVAFRTDATGKSSLDLSITPVDELCFIHVMRDNLALDMFDHSSFVPMIFKGFSGGAAAMTIPIGLSDLGIASPADQTPGQALFDDHGNCFLSMAVASLDVSKLTSGGCFIATAGK